MEKEDKEFVKWQKGRYNKRYLARKKRNEELFKRLKDENTKM